MSIPIFSYIISVCLICIFKKKYTYKERYFLLLSLSVLLEIGYLQGYLVKIGNSEISNVSSLVTNVLFLYATYILLIKKIYISKKILIMAAWLILSISLSMMVEILFPYEGDLLIQSPGISDWDSYVLGLVSMGKYYPEPLELLRLWMVAFKCIVIAIVFKQLSDVLLIIDSLNRIVKIGMFGVYYGIFEFVMKNIIGNLTITYDISRFFLGVNDIAVYTEAGKKDGIMYALQGLSREPSHFAVFIFSMCIFIMMMGVIGRTIGVDNKLIKEKLGNNHKKLLCLCIVALLMTGSFTAIWMVSIIGLVWLLFLIREKQMSLLGFVLNQKYKILTFALLILWFVDFCTSNEYVLTRIDDSLYIINILTNNIGDYNLIIQNGETSGAISTLSRFMSVYKGIEIYLSCPLLGISYDLQQLHDTTVTLLCGIGTTGIVLLAKFMGASRYNYNYDYIFIFICLFLGGIPARIAPADLCVYFFLLMESTTLYMTNTSVLFKSVKN